MNKFNLDRFVDILKKEWSEYFRAYGISLIVWSCIPVLLWIATLVFGNQIDADENSCHSNYAGHRPACGRNRRIII